MHIVPDSAYHAYHKRPDEQGECRLSDDEEVILLGPETVVARSQQPIPKAARHNQPGTPRDSLRKKGSPKAQALPSEAPTARDRSQTPTSAIHTFYWPTKPAVKGEVPHFYRTVFETKNHPR
jgi:hypothetical protein